MAKDIDTYRLIKQFVDWWCRRYYKHSQPEDREDMASEVALIASQNPSPVEDEKKKTSVVLACCPKCGFQLVASCKKAP